VSKLALSFKGMTLKIIPLMEGEMIIGSGQGSAIHIDSLAVQPRHASITTQGKTSVLRDLGSSDGTFVNNEKVAERELKNGDHIRVGKHELTFEFEAVTAPAAAPVPKPAPPAPGPAPVAEPEVHFEEFTAQARHRTAWLQIMSGHNLGKNISLNRALTNLGTPGIQTAVIAKRNDGYFLSHLEGEHPPRVGETAIGDKSWPLRDGDIIQIGNVKMQFYFQ
jgi:pSer/pThr/pTyr-binding forkhead associated (FHA) protein